MSGYFFAVQSYWPPRVVQRNFLVRSWEMESGLWMEWERGVAMGVGECGGREKNEEGDGDGDRDEDEEVG